MYTAVLMYLSLTCVNQALFVEMNGGVVSAYITYLLESKRYRREPSHTILVSPFSFHPSSYFLFDDLYSWSPCVNQPMHFTYWLDDNCCIKALLQSLEKIDLSYENTH